MFHTSHFSYDNLTGMNKAVAEPEHTLKPPLRLGWDISEEVWRLMELCHPFSQCIREKQAALEIEESVTRAKALVAGLKYGVNMKLSLFSCVS